MENFTDKLYERTKKDSILIPKGVRIVVDILFAIYVFGGMVVYPIYRCNRSGIWGEVDYVFIGVGLVVTLLFVLFVRKALKGEKQR